MSYLVTVDLWGPETGCELIASAQPEEVFESVCERAQPRLSVSLPGAVVVWVTLARTERELDGLICSGYRLSVTIRLARQMETLDVADEIWLENWIESEVAVSLLELINPMRVDGVKVMRPGGDVMDAL